MRFMMMIKANPADFTGPPPAALEAAIGRHIEEMTKAGVLVTTGGLAPPNEGATVRVASGRLSVVVGPFAEAREVVGGFAIIARHPGTRRYGAGGSPCSCTSTCSVRRMPASSRSARCSDRRRTEMRFMLLVIPKGYETAAPGTMPPRRRGADDELQRGADEGRGAARARRLHPPSAGARVSFSGGTPTVVDGPFAEAREVVGGYWMIQVRSRDEAIEWARRAPMGDHEIIEVRQVQEMSDFPPDVQAAAAGFDEMHARGR